MLNAAKVDASLQNVVFLKDCVATVSETGHVFVSLMNLTSNSQRIPGNTHLGTVVPKSLVYKAVPQRLENPKPKTEVDKDRIDFVHKVYGKIILNTDSQLTSSDFVFLPSELQLQEVKELWGSEARNSLDNILTEFDDVLMKHEAEIGR